MILAPTLISDSEWRVSLPEAHSRSSNAASTFSASSAQPPRATDEVSGAPSMPPFCVPCTPMARCRHTQRASRYSIDLLSWKPISSSALDPEVQRAFSPREAYAAVRNALDHGVSSPSRKAPSVP